jgi:hypothetical protein
MKDDSALAVTLTPALFAHLSAEAVRLDVPIEWLVAALVVDTVDEDVPAVC